MRRREVIAGLAAIGAARRSYAQSQAPMLRVGLVGALPRKAPQYVTFETRMAELGYQQGQNFAFEFVQTGNGEGYQDAFAELALRKVDIFISVGNEVSLRAALAVAGTRPIVLDAFDFDPFEKGYVASLSRPGGNVTGLFVRQLELAVKRVQFAREVLPGAHTLGLWCDALSRDQAEAAAAAARSLGFEPRLIEVAGQPPDYAEAAGRMAALPGEPVLIGTSGIILRDHAAIMALLLARRIPAVAAYHAFIEDGALLSYGVDDVALWRDVADYVDRIAKGAKPADLPISQPTRFELLINLKTAKTLGLAVPQSLLARADEVIE